MIIKSKRNIDETLVLGYDFCNCATLVLLNEARKSELFMV